VLKSVSEAHAIPLLSILMVSRVLIDEEEDGRPEKAVGTLKNRVIARYRVIGKLRPFHHGDTENSKTKIFFRRCCEEYDSIG
jgi:hypothetical protein